MRHPLTLIRGKTQHRSQEREEFAGKEQGWKNSRYYTRNWNYFTLFSSNRNEIHMYV